MIPLLMSGLGMLTSLAGSFMQNKSQNDAQTEQNKIAAEQQIQQQEDERQRAALASRGNEIQDVNTYGATYAYGGPLTKFMQPMDAISGMGKLMPPGSDITKKLKYPYTREYGTGYGSLTSDYWHSIGPNEVYYRAKKHGVLPKGVTHSAFNKDLKKNISSYSNLFKYNPDNDTYYYNAGYSTPLTDEGKGVHLKTDPNFAKKWGYADGGLLNNSQNVNNNITEYNAGGTHESNPFGGIPLKDGKTVEEGEVKFGDYVFSNRF